MANYWDYAFKALESIKDEEIKLDEAFIKEAEEKHQCTCCGQLGDDSCIDPETGGKICKECYNAKVQILGEDYDSVSNRMIRDIDELTAGASLEEGHEECDEEGCKHKHHDHGHHQHGEEISSKDKDISAEDIDDAQIRGELTEGGVADRMVGDIDRITKGAKSTPVTPNKQPNNKGGVADRMVGDIDRLTKSEDKNTIEMAEGKENIKEGLADKILREIDALSAQPVNEDKKVCPKCGKEPCECKKEDCKCEEKKVEESGKQELKEASQSFNVNSKDEMEEAEKAINKESEEEVQKVVDVDAASVDDLKKDYLGSVILQCPKCLAMMYKRPEEVKEAEPEVGEDGQEEVKTLEDGKPDIRYNKDEVCPHCGAEEGFRAVGQVAALNAPEQGEEEEVEDEFEDEPLPPIGDESGFEEENIDVDEFEESLFDAKINNYIKETYKNVKDYKTSKVDMDKNNIMIEGYITFNSGKTKKTSFNLKGNVVKDRCFLTGLNETFNKNFTVRGKLDNKKFITEVLKIK